MSITFVSRLPFPHGDGPGQIANGHNYDVNDTPGFPGGRFIGFGEDATSAISNRAAWALSTNIDYIYQKYASPIAVPQMDKFVSTGASNYHFSTTVFCGDDTYPPPHSAAEGLMLLFSVLDEQYNSLKDVDGNEVRVSTVMDDTDSDPVYGTGFVQTPWLHFYTVDSTGAVVEEPYPIPDGQVVHVEYGMAGSLEFLPVDAFTRNKATLGGGASFGALLLDGSLPMAGYLSMGNHGIGNIANLSGYEGIPITVIDNLNGNCAASLVGFIAIQNIGDGSIPVNAPDGFDGEGIGKLQNFASISLFSDVLNVNNGNLSSSAFEVPLFSPDDYVFLKEDFGVYNPDSYELDAVIGTWLQVVGVGDGTIGKDVDVVFDRSTVLMLRAPSTAGAIGLSGPALYINPTTSLLKFSVGFALHALSNPSSGETYTVIAGFSPDTIATDTGAYFLIDEAANMYAVWNDDTGDYQDLIPITIQPQNWYDCTISFNTTSVDFIVNGVTVCTADFTVASKSLLLSVPLRLTSTGSVNSQYLYIDYTEIHTKGHQPRALT